MFVVNALVSTEMDGHASGNRRRGLPRGGFAMRVPLHAQVGECLSESILVRKLPEDRRRVHVRVPEPDAAARGR